MLKVLLIILFLPLLALSADAEKLQYELFPQEGEAQALFEGLKRDISDFEGFVSEVRIDRSKTPHRIFINTNNLELERVLSLSSKYPFEAELVVTPESFKALDLLESFMEANKSLEYALLEVATAMIFDEEVVLSPEAFSHVETEVNLTRNTVLLNAEGRKRLDVLRATERISPEILESLRVLESKIEGLSVFVDVLELLSPDKFMASLVTRSAHLELLSTNESRTDGEDLELTLLNHHLKQGHSIRNFAFLNYFIDFFKTVSELKPVSRDMRNFQLNLLFIGAKQVHNLMENFGYSDLGPWNYMIARFLSEGKTFEEAREILTLGRGREFLDFLVDGFQLIPSVEYMVDSLSIGLLEAVGWGDRENLEEAKLGLTYERSLVLTGPATVTMNFTTAMYNKLNLKLDSSWVDVYQFSRNIYEPGSLLSESIKSPSGAPSCKGLL